MLSFIVTVPHIRPSCSQTPHPSPPPRYPQHSRPLPLARAETSVLLSRMLKLTLREEDFLSAARIRDTIKSLQRRDPRHRLQSELSAAVATEDYSLAASLRDELEHMKMIRAAEGAKPRYAMGLVVLHRRFGYRMVVFGVDAKCRAQGKQLGDVGLLERGEEQPWYHAAVDERDKTEGDNIVYVGEDDVVPAPEGVEVRHPIVRIMFAGMYDVRGMSCYVPACSDDD